MTTKGGKKKVFKHTKGQKRKRESDEIGAHEDSPPGSLPGICTCHTELCMSYLHNINLLYCLE